MKVRDLKQTIDGNTKWRIMVDDEYGFTNVDSDKLFEKGCYDNYDVKTIKSSHINGTPITFVDIVEPVQTINIITPHVHFLDPINHDIIERLENCGRVCWQSEPKGNPEGFIKNIIKAGHESVLEHSLFTFDIIGDRGELAEWTRHRIGCSPSVESTRYVKYDNNMEFIDFYEVPNEEVHALLIEACETSQDYYRKLINAGAKPQIARQVLNNSLKSHQRYSMNARSLRHFFGLRCASSAHPHIKILAIPMLIYFKTKLNALVFDIDFDVDFYEKYIRGHVLDHIIESDNEISPLTEEDMWTPEKG